MFRSLEVPDMHNGAHKLFTNILEPSGFQKCQTEVLDSFNNTLEPSKASGSTNTLQLICLFFDVSYKHSRTPKDSASHCPTFYSSRGLLKSFTTIPELTTILEL